MKRYFGLRSGYLIKIGKVESPKSMVNYPAVKYFQTQIAAVHYVFGCSYATHSEKRLIRRNHLDLVIYTDGGQRNANDGAWAYSINDQHRQLRFASRYLNTKNNNFCELEAVIQALRWLAIAGQTNLRIRLDTDSVAVKGIARKVRHGKSIQVIARNTDWQIKQLRAFKQLLHRFKHLRIAKIRGHSGVLGNQFVDQLCSRSMCTRYPNGYDPFQPK